jgi:hypothetical protein
MSDPAEWVVIRHPDGRSYSVTRKAFAGLYEGDGFVIDAPETPDVFLADVPAPVTRAGARRKTRKPARPTAKPQGA